jgi:ACT domain-containing protein
MCKTDHIILGVHITDRVHHVAKVQELLTEYGCNIKTRLGLHDADEKYCSPNGLLILELVGDQDKCRQLADKLSALDGIEIKQMIFGHP